MSTTPTRTTVPAQTTPQDGPANQVEALVAVLNGALPALAEQEVRTFKSGNTGLYLSQTLKAPAARDLGVLVPVGGKVKVQVTLIVVDPANSRDA